MSTFDGFFLPDVALHDVRAWESLQAGELRVRYPVLSASQIVALWKLLSHNRRRVLVQTPVSEIAQSFDILQAAEEIRVL